MTTKEALKTIIKMLWQLDEDDYTFIMQLHTIIKEHLKRKGRR